LHLYPILDRRLGLTADFSCAHRWRDRGIIRIFVALGRMAAELGFDFADVNIVMDIGGMNFLGRIRGKGSMEGSFENRTRFCASGQDGVAPGLKIGVRVSAFDTVPYRPDPALSANGKKLVRDSGVPRGVDSVSWGFVSSRPNPEQSLGARVFISDRETSMQSHFRTQAEYWLRLAHVAQAGEDKAQLLSMACGVASIRAGALTFAMRLIISGGSMERQRRRSSEPVRLTLEIPWRSDPAWELPVAARPGSGLAVER